MRAIILSAGQGSRLLPLTADRPKCLIEFSGRTLLDWQLDMLAAHGVTEATIVVGFRDDQVEAALARRSGGPRITTRFNPFYKVADNLGSVWIARDDLVGDCVTLNGDTLVSSALVAKVLGNPAPGAITVTVDEKGEYDADDMKVVRDADGRLARIGKRLGDAPVNAESIGFIRYSGDGAEAFRGMVERMLRTPDGTNNWYLKAIDALAQERRIDTLSIHGESWGEVDFPEDVDRARALTGGW